MRLTLLQGNEVVGRRLEPFGSRGQPRCEALSISRSLPRAPWRPARDPFHRQLPKLSQIADHERLVPEAHLEEDPESQIDESIEPLGRLLQKQDRPVARLEARSSPDAQLQSVRPQAPRRSNHGDAARDRSLEDPFDPHGVVGGRTIGGGGGASIQDHGFHDHRGSVGEPPIGDVREARREQRETERSGQQARSEDAQLRWHHYQASADRWTDICGLQQSRWRVAVNHSTSPFTCWPLL